MFVETFQEFKMRMGCECVAVKGRYLFRNGAQSDGELSHRDPPGELFARLKLEREFLQFNLDRKTKEFNTLKAEALEQSSLHRRYSNLPSPSPQAPDALRRIQKVVFELRSEIRAIDERLEERADNRHIKVQQDIRAEQLAQTNAILHEVQSIEI